MARDVRMLSIPDETPEILTFIQGREITGVEAFRTSQPIDAAGVRHRRHQPQAN